MHTIDPVINYRTHVRHRRHLEVPRRRPQHLVKDAGHTHTGFNSLTEFYQHITVNDPQNFQRRRGVSFIPCLSLLLRFGPLQRFPDHGEPLTPG